MGVFRMHPDYTMPTKFTPKFTPPIDCQLCGDTFPDSVRYTDHLNTKHKQWVAAMFGEEVKA